MPAGTLQQVVVCAAVSPVPVAVELRTGANAIIWCNFAKTSRQWSYSAYVVDAGSASYIDAIATPYDYAGGAALWAFGFSFVLGLWFVSRNIGLILEAIRKF